MTTGENLLHYTIENLTEENPFFQSFIAKHIQIDKQVIIRSFQNFANEQDKQNFVAEIRRLAQIQHPNILTLYDMIETPQGVYLVFEQIQGKTLTAYLNKVSGLIPEGKAKKLISKILDAFQLAHQYGICNGAIHPNHILITPDEEVKIMDLAFSPFFLKFVRQQDKDMLTYLSPEQIKEQNTDKRSDIYVIGFLLFQMLTGQNPYKGLPITEIKQKIIQEPLPDARQFYHLITDKMQAVIQKATDKDALKRFQDCADMKKAIELIDQKINPEQQIPQQIAQEEYADAIKLDIPLYTLIILGSLAILMLWRFNTSTKFESELITNLADTITIKMKKDSILQAKNKKNIEDSLKIISRKNPKDSAKIHYHRVQAGESLQSIANRFFMTLDELKKINELKGDENLSPRFAMKVWIRAVHSYKRGEKITDIAMKYKISDYAIRRANLLIEDQEIKEGKEIIIPLAR